VRTVALAAGEAFAALFPVVDPIGNAPTFATLTARLDSRKRRSEALRSAAVMAALLLGFLVAGEPLLRFFHISLEALQIAGGLVIAACGFQMVMAVGLPDPVAQGNETERGSVAFSPMAIPLLAGPGAMGIVMGLEARESDFLVIPGFALGIIAISALTYVCLRASGTLTRFFGPAGVDAITRIMGLLVLAIGIELIVHGIVEHGAVVPLHAP
jgi:multiple antibiotic resistance protein